MRSHRFRTWGLCLFEKKQPFSSVFQDVLNPAREDLGKRTKCRACSLVDVFGAALVLLNSPKIYPGQLAQLPLRQLIVLSPDLKWSDSAFLRKK